MTGKRDKSDEEILTASAGKRPEVYRMRRAGAGPSRREFVRDSAALLGAGAALVKKEARARSAGPSARPAVDIARCRQPDAHKKQVVSLAFSPDGGRLVSGSEDYYCKLWDISLGALSQTVANGGLITRVEYSPDGKWLVIALGSGIEIRSVKKGFALKKKLDDHGFTVRGIAVLPDGKAAVSADEGANILVWSLPTGRRIAAWQTKTASSKSMRCLALSPDGRLLATGESLYARLWSMQKGDLGTELDADMHRTGEAYSIAFSPDGQRLVVAGSNGYVKCWNVSDGSLADPVHEYIGIGAIRALAFARKGKLIIFGGYGSTQIDIRKFPSLKPYKTILAGKAGDGVDEEDLYCSCLAVSPDEAVLATAHRNRTLKLWDLKKRELLRCLVDITYLYADKSAITYSYISGDGRKVTVTVPNCKCAPPIPDTAVCECNTVRGNYCSCVGYTCSCVGACSCDSAHYWHPN